MPSALVSALPLPGAITAAVAVPVTTTPATGAAALFCSRTRMRSVPGRVSLTVLVGLPSPSSSASCSVYDKLLPVPLD